VQAAQSFKLHRCESWLKRLDEFGARLLEPCDLGAASGVIQPRHGRLGEIDSQQLRQRVIDEGVVALDRHPVG
jgi:hypothetical protein